MCFSKCVVWCCCCCFICCFVIKYKICVRTLVSECPFVLLENDWRVCCESINVVNGRKILSVKYTAIFLNLLAGWIGVNWLNSSDVYISIMNAMSVHIILLGVDAVRYSNICTYIMVSIEFNIFYWIEACELWAENIRAITIWKQQLMSIFMRMFCSHLNIISDGFGWRLFQLNNKRSQCVYSWVWDGIFGQLTDDEINDFFSVDFHTFFQ